jgi:hypothetical protein
MSKGDSIQKARLIKRENTQSKNGHPSTKITYMWLKDDGTQEQRDVTWVNEYLPPDSQKIYENTKEGGEFVVVKEDKGKGYWFKELRDISTYKPKPAYSPTGKYQGSSRKSGGYDDTGVKVGAARNQAIALLGIKGFADKLAPESTFNLNHVDDLAYEIIKRQAAMEERVRNEGKQSESELKTESHQQNQYPEDNDDSDVPF